MSQYSLRGRIAKCTPPRVREFVTTARLRKVRQQNAARSVEDVFTDVYKLHQWGATDTFDSGFGSRGQPATLYAAYVRDLVRETGARTLVDIGCGDFRVASQFVDALESYQGVDVVKDLLARNTSMYGRPGVTFSLLDASSSELPSADVCLIRQVLQHLSNSQIAEILHRCRRYRLVVVTEHWPASEATGVANLDKPHGPDTRLDRGSWVDIRRPPFNCSSVNEVLRVPTDTPLYRTGETIRSQLWKP